MELYKNAMRVSSMAQAHATLAAVDGPLHLHPGRHISSVEVPYGRIRDCIDTSAAEPLPIKYWVLL